jgi:hypothetical protein
VRFYPAEDPFSSLPRVFLRIEQSHVVVVVKVE